MSTGVLDEIALKIEQAKGWKGLSYFQVVRYIPTEFICYEKKGIIFSRTILWVDLDKLEEKIVVFFTGDKRIAETVRAVAALHGMTCEETSRDYFPPSLFS